MIFLSMILPRVILRDLRGLASSKKGSVLAKSLADEYVALPSTYAQAEADFAVTLTDRLADLENSGIPK